MKVLLSILTLAAISLTLTHAGEATFVGTWDTEWGLLVIKESKEELTGKYTGVFVGTIEGKVKEGKLHFTWKQTNSEWGSGVFAISDDGKKIKGTWGGGKSQTNGGTWSGTRVSP